MEVLSEYKFKPIDISESSESDNPIIRTPSPMKKMLVSIEGEGLSNISIQSEVKYFDTGMKKIREEKMLKNGKIHGLLKRWHDNGMLCEETQYDNGKLNGKQYYYSIYGTVSHEFNFADGLMHGRQTAYHPNGTVMSKMHYKNGIPCGERVTYYNTGTLKSLETYTERGLLTGTSRKWYSNGRLACDGTYIDGKLHGMYFEYNADDIPILALYFEHGNCMSRAI